jgi:hypothetical protein
MDHCQGKIKVRFTKKDDELIVKCVESMKTDIDEIKWKEISSKLPSRTNVQIRERYVNFLSPNINKNPLTDVEFNMLTRIVSHCAYLSFIPWKEIRTLFPGRSDIFLKNKYDCAKRKMG